MDNKYIFCGGKMLRLFICITVTMVLSFSHAHAEDDSVSNNVDPYAQIPEAVTKMLRSSLTLERFQEQLIKPIERYGRNGEQISEEDIKRWQIISNAEARSVRIREILRADLDGDGAVSTEEAKEQCSYVGENQTRKRAVICRATIEIAGTDRRVKCPDLNALTTQIDNQQKACRLLQVLQDGDLNKNAILEYTEMLQLAAKQKDDLPREIAAIREWIALDPNKDDVLTLTEMKEIARKNFAIIDANGDRSISPDEIKIFEAYRNKDPKVYNVTRTCPMPKIAEGELFVVYGTYEGDALSTLSVTGQNAETTTAKVIIEEGETPLYLVLSSYSPIIWQIEGDKKRINRVVIFSDSGTEQRQLAAGIKGIERDKITFMLPGVCFQEFSKIPSTEALQAQMVLKNTMGKNPDKMFASYTTGLVMLPSGDAPQGGYNIPAPEGYDRMLFQELQRLHNGGILAIEKKDVISPDIPEPYELLPGVAGITQLLQKGKLEKLYEEGKQYTPENMPKGEFRIVQSIEKLPIGLGMQWRFLLAKDVQMPKNPSVQICIISEETGARLNGIPGGPCPQ